MSVTIHRVTGAKKATAYTTYIALEATSGGSIQTSPTIAAGDFKVSKDGGAIANPNTLPAELPASSGLVKIVLDANEMNADQVVVRWIDQAGGEWEPGILVIETREVTVDELVRSSTPANALEVAATGQAACDLSNVKLPAASTTFTNVVIPTVDAVIEVQQLASASIAESSFNDDSISARVVKADAIQAIWDALTSALTTANSIGKLILDSLTALINRLGAFDGTGVRTVKGYLEAIANSGATKPTDFGNFDPSTDSLEVIGDQCQYNDDIFTKTQEIKTSIALLGVELYTANHRVIIDDAEAKDEHRVLWQVNGEPQAMDACLIRVIKDDGTDLIPETPMTFIPATPGFKYDATGVERMAAGASYQVVLTWQYSALSGSQRLFVGRDA